MKKLSEKTVEFLKNSQQNELTEAIIYEKIAKREKNQHNKDVLLKIAAEERKHEKIWQKYTQLEAKPKMSKVRWYTFLSMVLGFTFA
ncbi:MAG: ferritin family protein, partial [Oscillospiraceae bacterium]